MVEFIWKKANPMEKVAFSLGWIGALNLIFWITLVIVWNLNQDKKFWNKKTFFVVYVFGWIYTIFLVFAITVLFFMSITITL